MRRYKLIVFSRPAPGREQEYNDWYQNQHLRDVVTIDAFKSAQRFALQQVLSSSNPAWPYLAIYDIETDDIDAAVRALLTRAQTGQMQVSPTLSMEQSFVAVYEEFGPAVTASATGGRAATTG